MSYEFSRWERLVRTSGLAARVSNCSLSGAYHDAHCMDYINWCGRLVRIPRQIFLVYGLVSNFCTGRFGDEVDELVVLEGRMDVVDGGDTCPGRFNGVVFLVWPCKLYW